MKKAFTLIELLVVIAIIALLVSILLPSLQQAKFLAKMAVCKSGMRNIGIAAAMYASENDGNYPTGAYHNNPARGPENDFFGDRLMEFMDDDNTVFCCPLSYMAAGTWEYYDATYAIGRFRRFPTQNWADQTYMYFGNYSYDVQFHGLPALFTPEDISDIEAGLIYPRNNSAGRAKLFQDLVSDHPYERTSHESPNSLYTDGSVEQGPKNPYDLEFHGRWAGVNFWW